MPAPVFAAPSLEGARLALKALLVDGAPDVRERRHCAVAIDVLDAEGVLVQRALAHADVDRPVRDALRELVDRTVTRFAESQRLDEVSAARRGGDPYRGSSTWQDNDFHGFDCGFALATAKTRVAKLHATLRSAADMDIRLYAVPFLYLVVQRARELEEHVVLRREDGAYVYETVPLQP